MSEPTPVELTPQEARVLGVLVEKALTVPASYPMTVNAIVTGASQTSNRHPVRSYSEEEVYDALDGLRKKGLATRIETSSARVPKYRHDARERLGVQTPQLVVLVELMLRGPQTLGELRGRASRMHPLESLEVVRNVVSSLMEREPPLVRRLPPAAGSRAERYAQLLSPQAHPLDEAAAAATVAPAAGPSEGAEHDLAERVRALELEMVRLRNAIGRLAGELGAIDPLQ